MLDRDIAALLARAKAAPASASLSVAELRAGMLPAPSGSRRPVGSVEDRVLPTGLKARFYQPERRTKRQLVVYFHGGGFVVGNLETHDQVARDLCRAAGCAVLSVDYRLAPEHRFPAAVDDGLAAAQWTLANAESLGASSREIVLAGDSAGAALAIVTAIRLRDAGGQQPSGQILAYPVADYHTPATPSYLDNATGYGLTRAAMIRFWDEYLPSEAQARHPHASPLQAEDLGRLPSTLIVTAEYDPLRDEGRALAAKLRLHGTQVEAAEECGMIHGFLRMAPEIERTRQVFEAIGDWVKRLPAAAGA